MEKTTIELKTLNGMLEETTVEFDSLAKGEKFVDLFLGSFCVKRIKTITNERRDLVFSLAATGRTITLQDQFSKVETLTDKLLLGQFDLRIMQRIIPLVCYHAKLPHTSIDAFRLLPGGIVQRLVKGEISKWSPAPEGLHLLWARTLPIPRTLLHEGVSPITFYKKLLI